MTKGTGIAEAREFRQKKRGLAGCVRYSKSRYTGAVVAIYRCEEAGLDPTGGPWAAVCETHGAISNHATRTEAEYFAPHPNNWCEACARWVYEPDEQIWLPGGGSIGR